MDVSLAEKRELFINCIRLLGDTSQLSETISCSSLGKTKTISSSINLGSLFISLFSPFQAKKQKKKVRKPLVNLKQRNHN